ncbi:MAG: sugar ABC transporter permease [Thermaerobacter sp.]|nr:sugar ABC transporter permease [Thermaerobacter sp.]
MILIGLSIYPLVYLLKTSFTDYQMLGMQPTKFVGLSNYSHLLTSGLFRHSLAITGAFALSAAILQMGLGTGLAFLIRSLGRRAQTVLVLLLIPTIISPAVVAFQWVQLFNYQFGPVDYLLTQIGLKPLLWTGSPHQALGSLLLVDFWEWTPFVMLLVYAGLQSLPEKIFEASAIDGSTRLQTVRFITLPMLKPVLGIALILRLIGVFKMVATIAVLTNGGPGIATESVSYYTYVNAFTYFDIGYSAALAFVQLIIIMLLVKIILRLMKRPGVRTLA